jgi:hypothetical protein
VFFFSTYRNGIQDRYPVLVPQGRILSMDQESGYHPFMGHSALRRSLPPASEEIALLDF